MQRIFVVAARRHDRTDQLQRLGCSRRRGIILPWHPRWSTYPEMSAVKPAGHVVKHLPLCNIVPLSQVKHISPASVQRHLPSRCACVRILKQLQGRWGKWGEGELCLRTVAVSLRGRSQINFHPKLEQLNRISRNSLYRFWVYVACVYGEICSQGYEHQCKVQAVNCPYSWQLGLEHVHDLVRSCLVRCSFAPQMNGAVHILPAFPLPTAINGEGQAAIHIPLCRYIRFLQRAQVHSL